MNQTTPPAGTLKGTVVVVTGASSGIGEALGRLLARTGATVVLAARRRERLEAVARDISAEGGRAFAVQCDITDRAAAERLIRDTVREHGTLDVLINNAGRGHLGSVEDTTDEMILSMFQVNVFSLWYTTRPALEHMRAKNRGHIINIASIAGKVGFPFNSAYVAAKHAVVGFTRALRLELAETGIHASIVYPAGVLTEWAAATEEGALLPLFSESGPMIKRIAAERNLPLPPVEGVLPAERVAESILECIRYPRAEVYPHRGVQEFTVMAARDMEEAERYQLAVALGERDVYLKMKQT